MMQLLLAVLFGCYTMAASSNNQEFGQRIVAGAQQQIGLTLFYDPSYVRLSYPNGDVPLERGVCSDVVIRALRSVGLDLQLQVHQDMRAHFRSYPQNWGLKHPDRSIDHRRVPNLAAYFKRQGFALPVTQVAENYLPGDIVVWRLDNHLPHIGIIAERKDENNHPLIIHNIGFGTQIEKGLFRWTITGHYRIKESQ